MKKLFTWYVSTLFALLFPLLSIAQQPINGLIPKFYSITPAVDLIFNNQLLDPEQAHHFARSGEIDLSELNPIETTNIWSAKEKIQDDTIIDIDEVPEVEFQSKLISRLGIYRFTAISNKNEVVNFSFGKKIHNFLLRKNLLRKLGYYVPKIQYIKKIKVNFETSIDRDIFIAELADQTMAASERFILEETKTSLTLIDGLAMEAQNNIYNLALGTLPKHLIQGRRILRAVYVPLALVDVPESVNMMPWIAGREILENIKLYHSQDLVNTYGPALEDAKWITRKIQTLTRNDWEEIVSQAFYPKAVEALLTEKIIARRNHLQELFLSPAPLVFNSLVSYEDALENGELIQETFPGFVDRFSFGDPDSPFSTDEMSYFFMSKLMSTTITNAIAQFNSAPFMGVDEQQKVKEHVQKIYEQNGMFYESPLKAWFFPTARGQLVVSRDIVTGSYMGTSNQVQLVDTIGGFAEAGIFMGVDGLGEVVNASGRGTLSYQRTYSHIKPIKTLKKALKEPFKNMLVPIILNKLGNSLSATANQLQLISIVKELKDTLSVGESFIITDSLGGNLAFDAKVSISSIGWLDPKLLQAYAQVMSRRMIIKRLHITRSDENTIQVYNDLGKSNQLMFTFKLNSYLPILSINGRKKKGNATTEYYQIQLNDEAPKLALNLNALKQTLKRSSASSLNRAQTPYHITHDFKERGRTTNLFIFERNKIKSFDEIAVTHPKGATRNFLRRYDAFTKGIDIEGYAIESISNLVNLLWDQQVFINQTSLMNPGYGIFGKASNEIIVTEAEKSPENIINKFTTVKILYNGWKAKKKRLLNIMRKLTRRFGENFFSEVSLQNTNSVLLYQIGVDLYISQSGHTNLYRFEHADLTQVYQGYYSIKDPEIISHKVDHIMYLLGKIKLNEKNYPSFALEKLNQLIDQLVEDFDIKGLRAIFGKKGILVTAKMEGFRQGDEMGDKPLISDTYGYIEGISSPLMQVMDKTKIGRGELLLDWMMERAL